MNKSIIISLVHIFITGAFLIWIGWKNTSTPQWAYWVLLILGLAVLIAWIRKFSFNLIPLIHIFIIAPLLIYLGWFKNQSPYWLYQMSTIMGSAAVGYHALKLMKSM